MRFDVDELGSWNWLRTFRAAPPGLATGEKANGGILRRKTFGAGFEQAQQLWDAAARVPPDSKPLLLFYGLTQVGRAILAAFDPGQDWRGAGHGLRLPPINTTPGQDLSLEDIRVEPNGRGLIQQVAALLGSPVLAENREPPGPACETCGRPTKRTTQKPAQASMGQVLATIDKLDAVWVDLDLLNRPLEARELSELQVPDIPYERFTLGLSPVPAWVEERTIGQWLQPYRITERLGEPEYEWLVPSVRDGVRQASLQWSASGRLRSQWVLDSMDIGGEQLVRASGIGVVLIRLPGNCTLTHQLISWWLLLYQMSMLARYYPLEWRDLLDVDSSPLAVPIERVLNEAQHYLPFVIRDAIGDLKSARVSAGPNP